MPQSTSKVKRAASLARVSSQSQGKADRLGIPVQLEANRAYCERLSFDLRGEYTDQVSGASESREAFFRLLAEAEQYDVVVIYDLTRLARTEELSHRFLRLLQEAGLEVHSTTRGLLQNDVQTGIEIVMSAEERRRIYARTTSARIAIARKGELPLAMQAFGYTHVKREAIIIPAEAELVYRMYETSALPTGFISVARILQDEGVPTPRVWRGERTGTRWSAQTVARIIQNPIYKGEYVWRHTGSEYRIPVPAIVSPELWAAAQKHRRGPPSRLHFPLSGHLFCGVCGGRLSSRRTTRQRRPTDTPRLEEFYRCNSVAMPRFRAACNLPQFARSKLEPIVDTELRAIMKDPDTLRLYLEAERPPDPAKETERAHLEREDARWLEAFKDGAITSSELAEYRREIKVKLRALEALVDEAEVLPTAAYQAAADTMTLVELVEFAEVSITLLPNQLHFKLG